MIYSPLWGSRYATVLFKYLSQSWKTIRLLLRERPSVIFVMTPPVFACVPIWLYCAVTGARFCIDAHSGAFLDPRWSGLIFLHRFFSRRAIATIVTNAHLHDQVRSWGSRAVIVPDVPVALPSSAGAPAQTARSMTFVATFAIDEPVAEFFLAAASIPDVKFYVTGNHRKCPPDVMALKPGNVELLGFVSRRDYVERIRQTDAVLALTTLDHTMQRAAYEAIYAGRPVVTSDFELLRREFPIGTVHVAVTAEGIGAGIRKMLDGLDAYTREAEVLRKRKLERWNSVRSELLALMRQG